MLKRSLILLTFVAGASLSAVRNDVSNEYRRHADDVISALREARKKAKNAKAIKHFNASGLVEQGLSLAEVGLVKANKWNARAESAKRTINVLRERLANIQADPAGPETLSSLLSGLTELQRKANAYVPVADPVEPKPTKKTTTTPAVVDDEDPGYGMDD